MQICHNILCFATPSKIGVSVIYAGYESEENYAYLDEVKKQAYIKPANYETQKQRSYQEDIGRAENMSYDPQEDAYTCHNGKRLKVSGVRKKRPKQATKEKQPFTAVKTAGDAHTKKNASKGITVKAHLEERRKKSVCIPEVQPVP